MNLRQHILIGFFVVAGFKLLIGQDIHFSQFNASLLNLSPGYTGFFNGDYRVGAAYRSQWNAVPVSYSTFSMNGERRFRPLRFKRDMVGVGILFNNDRAGDAHYGTTQFYLQGSYIFLAKRDSSLLISVGANVGWCRVGFDYSKMTFENQYDGFAYNQSLGTGEQFSWTVRNFADFSIGSAVQYIHNKKHRFSYAIGIHHLSSPVITYQGNDQSRLDYKFTNVLGYTTPIKENTDLITEVLVSNQGKNYELVPHASLKYYTKRVQNQAILGGLCYRSRDAVVVRIGYTHKTLQSGMSYDINISRFNVATNYRGGIEFFVNYIFRVKPAFVAKKRYCPVFM